MRGMTRILILDRDPTVAQLTEPNPPRLGRVLPTKKTSEIQSPPNEFLQ